MNEHYSLTSLNDSDILSPVRGGRKDAYFKRSRGEKTGDY